MKTSRRRLLALAATAHIAGCSLLHEPKCLMRYRNFTGRWISGIASIGKIIRDGAGGIPLGGHETTSRISIISGVECSYDGVDEYSREPIHLTGYIPEITSGLVDPYVTITLGPSGEMTGRWSDSRIGPSSEETVREFSSIHELVPMIWLGPRGRGRVEAALRQRPVNFGTNWMELTEISSSDIRERVIGQYVAAPDIAWDCVLTFADWDVGFGSDTWRDTVDLRQLPARRRGANALWFETQSDGTYRIGWFSHEFETIRELQSQVAGGHVRPPQEFLIGRAKKHPIFELAGYRGSVVSASPDLRFDDEM